MNHIKIQIQARTNNVLSTIVRVTAVLRILAAEDLW